MGEYKSEFAIEFIIVELERIRLKLFYKLKELKEEKGKDLLNIMIADERNKVQYAFDFIDNELKETLIFKRRLEKLEEKEKVKE